MQTVESEIIEKFRLLDRDAQERVRALIEQEIDLYAQLARAAKFDHDAWFHKVEALRQEIQTQHGDTLPSIDVVSLLRDIRDGEDEYE